MMHSNSEMNEAGLPGAEVNAPLRPDPEGFWIGPNPQTGYWGELERSDFLDLIARVADADCFSVAVQDFFRTQPRKDLLPYINDLEGRGAWYRLLRTERPGVAVDLGAGLGAISEFLAARCDRVYAVEGNHERCRFLALRRTKNRLDNLTVIHNDLLSLPFRDGSVDLVACNGVLEWVASGAAGKVRELQLQFLREIRRVLKPNGILYVGIENRIGRQYFQGAPDHPGTRYTSLVPRWCASLMVQRFARKQGKNSWFSASSLAASYRTYTYSAHGYRALLAAAGFGHTETFCAEPSYDIPRYAFPFDAPAGSLRRFFQVLLGRRWRGWDDRFRSNHFFMYASGADLEGRLRREPVFFGFFDVLRLEGSHVVRDNHRGLVRREPIAEGMPITDGAAGTCTTQQVVEAYDRFLAGTLPAAPEARLLEQALAGLGPVCLGPELLAAVRARIETMRQRPPGHGDLWVGNLIAGSAGRELTLIDPEQHLFGSQELDLVDFWIDFTVHRRQQQFPGIDPEHLARHYGVDLADRTLVIIALFRQVVRYSAFHRSNALVYSYLELLEGYLDGSGRLRPSGDTTCAAS